MFEIWLKCLRILIQCHSYCSPTTFSCRSYFGLQNVGKNTSFNLCIYLEQKTTNQANFCTTRKQEQQFIYWCCINDQIKLLKYRDKMKHTFRDPLCVWNFWHHLFKLWQCIKDRKIWKQTLCLWHLLCKQSAFRRSLHFSWHLTPHSVHLTPCLARPHSRPSHSKQ